MGIAYNTSIVRSGLVLQLDALNAKSYTGSGIDIVDITSNGYDYTLFGQPSSVSVDGVTAWNFTNDGYMHDSGQTFEIAAEHTYMAWARLKTGNSTRRTLWRTQPDDHPLLIDSSSNDIGWYDNSANTFRSFGLDAVALGLENVWALYTVVGTGSECTCYINDGTVNGTSTAGNTAGQFQDTVGNTNSSEQPFGYVSTAMIYNRALSAAEVRYSFEVMRERHGV